MSKKFITDGAVDFEQVEWDLAVALPQGVSLGALYMADTTKGPDQLCISLALALGQFEDDPDFAISNLEIVDAIADAAMPTARGSKPMCGLPGCLEL